MFVTNGGAKKGKLFVSGMFLPEFADKAKSLPVKWSTIKFSTEASFGNLNLNLILIPSRCSTLGQAPGLTHKH